MRHGKIGWCAAIVLAAMASVTVRAAAPPVKGVERDDSEVRSWVSGECGSGTWKVQPTRQQREAVARAGSCREGCLAADSSGSTVREVTIVVRIKSGIDHNDALLSNPLRRRVALPPAHAVFRQAEADAVLASLQDKLLELHEPGLFELAIDRLGTDHSEVNISYEPVDPPPAPIDFSPFDSCCPGGIIIDF